MARWILLPLLISVVFAVVLTTNDQAPSVLLVIDVQNCFSDGGTMGIDRANEIIPVINQLRRDVTFDAVVHSQDWHCRDHVSFKSQHPNCNSSVMNLTYIQDTGQLCWSNDECANNSYAVNCTLADQLVTVSQRLWPDHCVINTTDAEFNSQLIVDDSDMVVRKGYYCQIDSYSAFFDNGHIRQTDLDQILRDRNIENVYIVGLAIDFCVFFTATDSSQLGYHTYIVLDATRAVSESTAAAAIDQMLQTGIHIINSKEVAATMVRNGAAVQVSNVFNMLAVVSVLVLVLYNYHV
jgi:nicotinamidase/pyrazinamidase